MVLTRAHLHLAAQAFDAPSDPAVEMAATEIVKSDIVSSLEMQLARSQYEVIQLRAQLTKCQGSQPPPA